MVTGEGWEGTTGGSFSLSVSTAPMARLPWLLLSVWLAVTYTKGHPPPHSSLTSRAGPGSLKFSGALRQLGQGLCCVPQAPLCPSALPQEAPQAAELALGLPRGREESLRSHL